MRMRQTWLWMLCIFLLDWVAPLHAEPPAVGSSQAIVWDVSSLESIGGQQPTAVGKPRVLRAKAGPAIEFDGKGDALFLDSNPLAGLAQFTAEVVFQPARGGPKEQRFLHFQEAGSENRLLFETRLTDDGQWFLDTFIQSADTGVTLFAKEALHPIGPWYHAAVVVDGKTMRHFVNGKEELQAELKYQPQKPGQTSIGVRFNKVFWYQGAIRQIRITPWVLEPRDFLQP